ncbi:MAG: acetylornithine deacetylase [Thermoplasmata archaeon]|nr:MAG: acetylornithine deacetylase [Thermoplasmata archaeon]
MHAEKMLMQLLSIDSPSKSEEEIAKFISNFIRNIGFDVIIDEIGNVVVKGNEKIVVATHIDTIKRKIKIRKEGNKIYGTGACDAKASVASLLLFLQKIKKLNFTIAFLCDEEEDAKGSEFFLKSCDAEIAVIMEPTSLKLCNYHAGNIEAIFEVYGEEMHGSFCSKNAIENAIEMFHKIKKLNCWKKGKYFDSCITLHEIICENPFYLNPKVCKGRLEARILAEQSAKKIAKEIENVAKEYGKVEFKEIWNGFEVNEKEEIIKICKDAIEKAGIRFSLDGMPSWTDAIRFNEKGIKCVVFGPGNLKIAHTEKEYIDLKEIEMATNFLFNLNEILDGYHHSFQL